MTGDIEETVHIIDGKGRAQVHSVHVWTPSKWRDLPKPSLVRHTDGWLTISTYREVPRLTAPRGRFSQETGYRFGDK